MKMHSSSKYFCEMSLGTNFILALSNLAFLRAARGASCFLVLRPGPFLTRSVSFRPILSSDIQNLLENLDEVGNVFVFKVKLVGAQLSIKKQFVNLALIWGGYKAVDFVFVNPSYSFMHKNVFLLLWIERPEQTQHMFQVRLMGIWLANSRHRLC